MFGSADDVSIGEQTPEYRAFCDSEPLPKYGPSENNPPKPEFKPDSIVTKIRDKFLKRAEFGFKKYGTTLDRTDLDPEQWATHIGEELHDALLYVEKWKEEQANQKRFLELFWRRHHGELSYNETCEFTKLYRWYEEKESTSKTPKTNT